MSIFEKMSVFGFIKKLIVPIEPEYKSYDFPTWEVQYQKAKEINKKRVEDDLGCAYDFSTSQIKIRDYIYDFNDRILNPEKYERIENLKYINSMGVRSVK
jgi:hypothetical protein